MRKNIECRLLGSKARTYLNKINAIQSVNIPDRSLFAGWARWLMQLGNTQNILCFLLVGINETELKTRICHHHFNAASKMSTGNTKGHRHIYKKKDQ